MLVVVSIRLNVVYHVIAIDMNNQLNIYFADMIEKVCNIKEYWNRFS